MALSALPNELLGLIIEYSLSLDFQNLAMTCKRIYAGCKPFIQRHNELRSRFEQVSYYARRGDCLVAASDLIGIIAADPIVAEYIRTARLDADSQRILHSRAYNLRKSVPSIEDGGDIVQLFANSRYLQRAGIDWKEYYSTFAADVEEDRYSQHGSVFLLTLLNNVEYLIIPRSWKPNDATNQLLDTIINEAKQPSFQFSSPGLRSVTSIHVELFSPETWTMRWTRSFFALPHLKSVNASEGFAIGEDHRSLAFGGSAHIAESLGAAYLSGCIDDVGITDFLKHTPRLKTLDYLHSTQRELCPRSWNICKFVNAVAREAGRHLIAFSVLVDSEESMPPGKVSTRGFQKLEKFQIPLELVTCHINAAGITGNIASSLQRLFNASQNPFLRDLVPPSVMELSLDSDGIGPYDKGLDALFSQLSTTRKSQLPNLQNLYICCVQEADSTYKQQCNRIVREGRTEGVHVHLAHALARMIPKSMRLDY